MGKKQDRGALSTKLSLFKVWHSLGPSQLTLLLCNACSKETSKRKHRAGILDCFAQSMYLRIRKKYLFVKVQKSVV